MGVTSWLGICIKVLNSQVWLFCVMNGVCSGDGGKEHGPSTAGLAYSDRSVSHHLFPWGVQRLCCEPPSHYMVCTEIVL